MDNNKLYTPAEAAAKLGITVETLKYLRQRGRIKGTFIGNTTLYTEEQIKNADLSKQKPGPKPPKKTLTTQDSDDEAKRKKKIA
jgi:hypothetical protein